MILAALLALQQPAAPPDTAADPVALVQRVQPAVVRLRLLGPQRREAGLGSGFIISGGHVASARHGLLAADGAEVELRDGRVLAVLGVVADDPVHDLVLLAVAWPHGAPDVVPLPLAAQPPPVGARVTVFGSPLGLEATVADGLVSAVGELPGLGPVLTISAPISPGSSGGPVVDARGQVVGVVRGKRPGGENLNFAAAATDLAALVVGTPVPVATWSARARAAAPAPEILAALRAAIGALGRAPAQALAQARALRDEVPSLAQAWQVEALALRALGEHQAAFGPALRAVELAPGDPEAVTNLGTILGALGRGEEEIECYLQALRLAPEHLPALYNLGECYEQRGAWVWAAVWYRRVLEAEPRHAAAIAGLGRVAGHRGRPAEAVEYFREAIAIAPEEALFRSNLASALVHLGRREEAVEELRHCIELDPNLSQIRERRARLLGELGRADEQLRELREALRRDPDSADAHFQLGEILLARGDRRGAFEEYRILHELDAALAETLLKSIYPDGE
jgi:tetratricopeptide (TPR) repeat protein